MNAFPFTSINGDRKITATDLGEFIGACFNTGIFDYVEDCFKVIVDSTVAMGIIVRPGKCVISNAFGYEDTETKFTLTKPSTGEKYYSPILRLDTGNRVISIALLEGDSATNATIPNLTRDANTYELRLANIKVTSTTTTITTSIIEDTRRVAMDCGVATCPGQFIDLSDIVTQANAIRDEAIVAMNAKYDALYESIAGKFEGDVGGNLALSIASLEGQMTGKASKSYVDEKDSAMQSILDKLGVPIIKGMETKVPLGNGYYLVEHVVNTSNANGKTVSYRTTWETEWASIPFHPIANTSNWGNSGKYTSGYAVVEDYDTKGCQGYATDLTSGKGTRVYIWYVAKEKATTN